MRAWSNLLRLFFYACKEDWQMAKGIEKQARSPPSVFDFATSKIQKHGGKQNVLRFKRMWSKNSGS